jgi:signal transduction histidine kinase
MGRKEKALENLKSLRWGVVFLTLFLVSLVEVYFHFRGATLIEHLLDFGIAIILILAITEFTFRKINACQSEILQKESSLKQLLSSLNNLTPTTPLSEAMKISVKKATEAINGDAGCIGTFDKKTKQIVYLYVYNLPQNLTQHLSPKNGLVSQVIKEEKGVVVNDYPNHPKRVKEFSEAGVKTLVVAPIISREGCLGALGIMRFTNEPFSESDLEIVQAVANLNAFLFENARFFEKWQNEMHRKENIARKALIDIENERKLLAAEIHDTILQNLIALKQRVIIAKRKLQKRREKNCLEELSSLTEEAITTVHSLLSRTTFPLLEDLGLKQAIHALADSLFKNGSPKVEIEVEEFPELDDLKEVNIFRITQEALQNIRQHAHASNVSLILRKVNGHIELIVEDDGKGFRFDPEFLSLKNHPGLLMIKERVQLIGGKVKITSQKNKGTKIKALIPIK